MHKVLFCLFFRSFSFDLLVRLQTEVKRILSICKPDFVWPLLSPSKGTPVSLKLNFRFLQWPIRPYLIWVWHHLPPSSTGIQHTDLWAASQHITPSPTQGLCISCPSARNILPKIALRLNQSLNLGFCSKGIVLFLTSLSEIAYNPSPLPPHSAFSFSSEVLSVGDMWLFMYCLLLPK